MQYSDGVLKSLPDIKTVITLRQQLSGRGTPAGFKVEAALLTPDEVLRNTGVWPCILCVYTYIPVTMVLGVL